MRGFTVRSHYWGPLVMVVVAGVCDLGCAPLLSSHLRRAERDSDLVVDLWDVEHLAPEAVGVLAAAKRSADASGWGFAVVADPTGQCMDAIGEAGEMETLRPYASRHDARRALQLAES